MRPSIIVLLAALTVSSCSVTPHVAQLGSGSYQIPIVPAEIKAVESQVTTAIVGTISANEPVVAESSQPVEMEIVVPPSDKPTKVEIRKSKRSVVDKVLTNKPAYSAQSDNPQVQAYQPKKTLWWRWLLVGAIAFVFVLGFVIFLAQRFANFSVVGWLFKKR